MSQAVCLHFDFAVGEALTLRDQGNLVRDSASALFQKLLDQHCFFLYLRLLVFLPT